MGNWHEGNGYSNTYESFEAFCMSANSARVTDDKFCTETGESCTKNKDCDGDDNKCNRRKTNKNLGVFEVALPLRRLRPRRRRPLRSNKTTLYIASGSLNFTNVQHAVH